MQMIIKKDNEKLILIDEQEKIIEVYQMSEAIDFNGLMKYLIEDELNDDFFLNDIDFELSEQETTLVSLIKELLDNYNSKVRDFALFKSEYEK